MANNIVQLTDYDNNNIYPIAGAAAQGSITKAMLDEGVFVGAELSDPGLTAYVATADIQDSAVTTAKIADLNVTTDKLATGAVTSDKIDSATIDLHDYKTSKITSESVRAIITVKGGIGLVTIAGDTTSSSGVIYDNIPISVPFTQELALSTVSTRIIIGAGTNPGTSQISVNSGPTYPLQLFLTGSFITS